MIEIMTSNLELLKEIKKGDEIKTTTSSFNFDMLQECFDSEALPTGFFVEVEKVGQDLSEYDPQKCRTGGKYAYFVYEVSEVLGFL